MLVLCFVQACSRKVVFRFTISIMSASSLRKVLERGEELLVKAVADDGADKLDGLVNLPQGSTLMLSAWSPQVENKRRWAELVKNWGDGRAAASVEDAEEQRGYLQLLAHKKAIRAKDAAKTHEQRLRKGAQLRKRRWELKGQPMPLKRDTSEVVVLKRQLADKQAQLQDARLELVDRNAELAAVYADVPVKLREKAQELARENAEEMAKLKRNTQKHKHTIRKLQRKVHALRAGACTDDTDSDFYSDEQ